MSDAREQLASLVLEAIRANVDAYVRPLPDDEDYSEDLSSAIIDSHGIDLRAVADAILAAGWTPPKPVKFGRWYRTVLPDGTLWAETSDPQDWYLAHPDPSVTLTWQRITTDETWVEWVDHPTDMVHPSAMDWGD